MSSDCQHWPSEWWDLVLGGQRSHQSHQEIVSTGDWDQGLRGPKEIRTDSRVRSPAAILEEGPLFCLLSRFYLKQKQSNSLFKLSFKAISSKS